MRCTTPVFSDRPGTASMLDVVKIEAQRLKNFIIRDFHIAISYKFQFTFQLLQIFFAVLSIYFVGRMLKTAPESIGRYGGDYFNFALVGLALNSYLRAGLVTITNDIRQSMNLGTLEAVCVTPVSHLLFLLYSSVWQFVFETFKVVCYFIIGNLIFGARFDNCNLAGALLVLFLIVPIFMMLGIISSSLIILIKRGDPIYWIFSSVGGILAGMLFPVSVMPSWLQKVSYFMPLTHALEAMRLLLLKGQRLSEVSENVYALLIFCLIFVPVTYVINKSCMKLARKNGSFSTH